MTRREIGSRTPGPESVEDRIVQIGHELSRTLAKLLAAIPGSPHRPQSLARALGVNIVLTSRVLKAMQQSDPLAVVHSLPGPEPLRRILRSAERKKVHPGLIDEASAAVDRFQQLIGAEAGDRSALDAIISGWLPDAREKVELLAKQSVFRGVSQLLGSASEVEHFTMVQYPSAQTPGRADQVILAVTRGLRRLRSGLPVKYDTVHATSPLFTVTGERVEELHGLLLEPFCSKPLPQMHVSRYGDRAQYTLSGDEVGLRSAVHLAHATYLQGQKELYLALGEPPRKTTLSVGIANAIKTLIFDVLVHEDVYAGQHPSLHLYRAMPYGAASPNDPSRDADRLDIVQSIQPLGRGIAKFRAAENPDHVDMLRYICERRKWDGNRLRGYRCRIEYPVYSSEIVMAFDLPVEPESTVAQTRAL
jgi:hypothetical protein